MQRLLQNQRGRNCDQNSSEIQASAPFNSFDIRTIKVGRKLLSAADQADQQWYYTPDVNKEKNFVIRHWRVECLQICFCIKNRFVPFSRGLQGDGYLLPL